MAEELKSEIGKLENLIGCEKADITSKDSIKELINALNSKYKNDVHSSIRLHRLEFYQALIEDARLKKKKSVEVEETFLLAKDDKDAKDAKDEDKENTVALKGLERPTEVVSVPPEEIDEWKNLMTLSKIYYLMEHPTSKGLTWERRVRKKKHISQFTDKDLIEWRVSQNFRLKAMEEWALSRSEARKLAEESPYDFDDLLDDDESRQLEDMFNVLDTQKQSKKEVGALEKELHTKRPFKFKDEKIEDWAESYSDDSEQSDADAEDRFCEILEFEDELDFEIEDYIYNETSGQPSLVKDESISTGIFSSYKEIPKYKRPIFEAMEETKDMTEWYDLCHDAIGEGRELKKLQSPPTVTIATPENAIEPLKPVPRANGSAKKIRKTSFETISEEDHKSSTHDEEYKTPVYDEADEDHKTPVYDEVDEDHKTPVYDEADEDHKTTVYNEKDHKKPAHSEKDRERPAQDEDHKRLAHDKEDLTFKSQVDKKATKPDSEDFMVKHRESEIGSIIKLVISKARSSASDIVQERLPEDADQKHGKPVEDLESVLRVESMSKGSTINIGSKKSSSQKDMVEEKVKSIISMAKKSHSDKLNGSLHNKGQKSAVKEGIHAIISEAKSSAKNLVTRASPESVSTDSLEYVLRQESASKLNIDKTNTK